jgi:hypothetical protein
MVIEGNRDSSRELLLHSMREMLITEAFAPMNVDLFYDQFFDSNRLSEEALVCVSMAKKAWFNAADHFAAYVDHGLDEMSLQLLNHVIDTHDSSFVDYRMLKTNETILTSLDLPDQPEEALAFITKHADLFAISGKRADCQVSNHTFHAHLPDTFGTATSAFRKAEVPTGEMTRAIFESPFAGDFEANTQYAARCIANLVMHHQIAPMASHLVYTRMLDDTVADERRIGIDAGLSYGIKAHKTVIGVDRGLSTGMKYGIKNAMDNRRPLTFFTLSNDPDIIKQVDRLSTSSLAQIETWFAHREQNNKAEFDRTGYLIPVCDCSNPCSQRQTNKQRVSL